MTDQPINARQDPAAAAKVFCDWAKRPTTIITPSGVAEIRWGDYQGIYADVTRAEALLASLPSNPVLEEALGLLAVALDMLETITPEDPAPINWE